jgi:hypothetical protein
MAADFNHDGILDLIGEYGGDLEFYAGRGDGTFHFGSVAGRNYPGTLPAVYGDFNGDGNLDLAFPQASKLQFQPPYMVIMLGDGQGKFTVGSRIRDLTGFGLTAVGDFNGDGKLDLVTKGQVRFSVFLGNGDGTFQRFKTYPYSPLTAQMITGDFNGDGKLDIVLMQEPLPNNNNLGIALYILLGNGNGTFQPPREIASFPSATSCSFGIGTLQLSDFNGDGKADLAFCDNQGQIGILLGNGDGTFQPAVFYDASTGIFTYTIGDINADGIPDLLVSQHSSFDYSFVVLFGNGDGTFQSPDVLASGIPFAEPNMVTGDFNSDGRLDFIFQTGLGMDVFIQH